MNQPTRSSPNPEVLELLAGSVLDDLSAGESAQLAELNADRSFDSEYAELERTAAIVQLVLAQTENARGAEDSVAVSMPQQLRAQILTRAPRELGGHSVNEAAAMPPETAGDTSNQTQHITRRQQTGFSVRELFAWVACAAALLTALGLWQASDRLMPVGSDPIALRGELLDSLDTIKVAWVPGSTPLETNVSGDVVWNTARQEGVLRFQGLPPNNPTLEQYQLWIIDPARDEEPIDGGVFDIPSDDEVYVNIDAKLKVIKPAAFAITIEQPGGVVVSTQERLPLLAAVQE